MSRELLAGRYELLDLVGSGRQGEVYRAKDHWDSSTVALKLLAADETAEDLMVWADLRHPNIVRVLDVGFTNGKPYLALEYVEGPTLREAYISGGEPILLSLVADICLALQTVHSRGICHGDLKPTNILVEAGPGDSLRAKVTDLGLWRLVGAESEGFSGTLAYAAPEVLKGEAPDQRSDLYSLGACLYEVITGKPVFECNDLRGIVRAHLEENPTDPREFNPSISDKLATVVLSLLAKEPTRRISSAGEVLDRLGVGRESALPGEPAWVGRQREQRFIERLEELAAEGKGNLALVVGEDGIGKSALLERAYLKWGVHGGSKLWLSCGAEESTHDLAEELIRRALVMAGMDEGDGTTIEATVMAMRFIDTCRPLTEGKPLLVMLEDVGRADASFLGFLGALVPLLAPERMLIVASVDRQELAATRQAIPLLLDLPQVRKVSLRAFTARETETLVSSLLCRETAAPGLLTLICCSSGGNPGLMCEAVRNLAVQGYLRRVRGRWTAKSLPRPEAIEVDLVSVVESRIRNLSNEQGRIVGALALLGRSMSEDALAEVAGFDRARLGELVGILENAHIVARHGEQWLVRNRALARAAKSVLSESEKAELHAAAARVIEARWPGDSAWRVSFVRHLMGCERKEDAYEKAMAGATRVYDMGQHGIALKLYNLAEQCLPVEDAQKKIAVWKGQAYCYLTLGRPGDGVERLTELLELIEASDLMVEEIPRLKLSLSEALADQGRLHEASEHIDAILTTGIFPQNLEAETLSVAASVANKSLEPQRAEKFARKCLECLNDLSDERLMAKAETCLGWAMLNWTGDEARAHLERGYRLAEKVEDALTVVKYANNLGWVHVNNGKYEEAGTYFQTTLTRAEAAGSVGMQAGANYALAVVEHMQGFPRQACARFERAQELAIRCGAWGSAGKASIGVASAQQIIGEWGQAARRLKETLVLGRRRGIGVLTWQASSSLGELNLLTGHLDVAQGWYAEARRIAERHDNLMMLGVSLLGLARTVREQGKLDEADVRLSEAYDAAKKEGNPSRVLHARCELAELRLDQGRTEEALATIEDTARKFDEVAFEEQTMLLRLLGRARAMSGRHEEAASAFTQCLELMEGTEYVGQIALARLEVGRWLEAHGQVPGFRAAERYLTQARDSFQKMGARLRLKETETLLRRINTAPAAGLTLPIDDAQKLASLYRMVAMVNSAKTSGGLLEQVLDLALHAVRGERGLVILVDRTTRELLVKAKTEVDNGTIADARRISETVVRDVAGAGESVFSTDALRDARFSEYESIHLNRIACFMCVPLTLREKILGTIYVDSCSLENPFTDQDVSYLRAFAHQAAIAMENMRFREELEKENEYLQSQLEAKSTSDTLVGHSPQMEAVYGAMTTMAQSLVTVVIQGETGTGKEVIASAIHCNGPRSKLKFVPVNCAALPDTLLESELFGYMKGAFTGAMKDSPGLFQLADGGTIFLDEIGDMSPNLQAKLLRVLQTGEVKQLGRAEAQHVDVRVIAATNRDLEKEVRAGRFREDLYYRLKGVTINVPPLRERREDIPLLAAHFLERSNERLTKQVRAFSNEAMTYLCTRQWPGNVRELEHIVEAAVALCPRRVIDVETLRTASGTAAPATEMGMTLREAQQALEKRYVQEALQACRWNVTKAGKQIGLARQQVQRIIRRHGIEQPAESG